MPKQPRPEARIYLDCDGVLADFAKGAEAVLGMPSRRFEQRFGLKAFWGRIASAPDFFDTLEPMPDAMELYAAVRHLDPVILTGLPRGAWAEPQKRRWAAKHFPELKMITTSAALKREHCQPGDILVDDTDRYRHLWENAGGVFVHHTDAPSTIKALKKMGML